MVAVEEEVKERKAAWGCRSVDVYVKLNNISEGAYGVVSRGQDKATGAMVALKRLKMDRIGKDGFPLTALREINALLNLKHRNLTDLMEVVTNKNSFFIVMEYLPHDLRALMDGMAQPFWPSEVKCLMLQLLAGVAFMHENWIVHRDLKTSNLLMDNKGTLKIADFGLARSFGEPLKPLTPGVVTLWYRAPELLLGGDRYAYSTAVDVWSCGCIFGEFLRNQILIQGSSEPDQIKRVFRLLGTPDDVAWPNWRKLPGARNVQFPIQKSHILGQKFSETELTPQGTALMLRLLCYDPERRESASQAMSHPYFVSEKPRPKEESAMPSFRPTQEGAHQAQEPKAQGPVMMQANEKLAGSIFDTQTVNYDAYLSALEQAKK
jgi:cell division cycle 2-like protein